VLACGRLSAGGETPSDDAAFFGRETRSFTMSSRGYPSLTALLGLLAVAGFQNRDKIAEMLRGATGGGAQPSPSPSASPQGQLGGLLGNLGSSGSSVGGFLGGSLGELMDRFRQNGQGDVADSWVAQGPNKEVAPKQLEQAIGPDVLATLTQQTGLSREEILARLAKELPSAVDRYTPDGRLPA